jgi:hypothetical protein
MTDPRSLEEYTERFHKNYSISGMGEDVRISFPCPFCGARDWLEIRLMEFGAHDLAPHYCVECDRSSRFIFKTTDGGIQAELVQCSGPDAPRWMVPTPRREDRDGEPTAHSEGFLVKPAASKRKLRTPPGMRRVEP